MRSLRYSLCLLAALLFLTGRGQAAEPVFKQGDKSTEIAAVQMQMRELGYIAGAPDGFYSWRFSQAVKAYQRSQGLKADGIIDSLTYLRIMGKPFPTPPKVTTRKVPEKAEAKVGAIIATAKKFIGVPYKFGGTTAKGFDCSGFLQYVFSQHGKKIPRSADVQYTIGKPIARNQLQPGDLVFFSTYEPGPSHDGIYLGNGQFIHASSSRGVMISKLDEVYWRTRYFGARRII